MRTFVISFALCACAAAHADGTIEGTLGPSAPKHAAVWLEGIPATAWTPPKDIVKISQRGARFNPDFVVVPVGQTVAMPNDDRLIHNVFSVSPAKKFDLGHYPQGESRSVVFEKAGVIDLFCNIHENMHGTVVVAPSTFFAVADAGGHFAIAHVPPGTYKVSAFSPDAGAATSTVKVTAGTAAIHLTLEKKIVRLREQLLIATCGTALFCVVAGDRLLTWRARGRGVEVLDRELATGQSAIEREWMLRRGELRGILQGIANQSYFRAYLTTRDRAQMEYFAHSARNAGAEAVVITDRTGASLAEDGDGAAGLAELARDPVLRASGGLAALRGVLVDVTSIPVGEEGSTGFLLGVRRVSADAIHADGAPFGLEAGLEAGGVLVTRLAPDVAQTALRSLDHAATAVSRSGIEFRVRARRLGNGRLLVAAPLSRAEEITSDVTRLAGILFLVVLIVAASGVVVAMNRMTAPLERMQKATESLGRGDPLEAAERLTALIGRRDEIGTLARSLFDAANRLRAMITTCSNLSRAIERTLLRTNRLVTQADSQTQSEAFGEAASAAQALAVTLGEVWLAMGEAQAHGRNAGAELNRLEAGSASASSAVERARSLIAAAEQKVGDLDTAVGRDLSRVLVQAALQLSNLDKGQAQQARGVKTTLEALTQLRAYIDKASSAQLREQLGRSQATRAVETLGRLLKGYGQDARAVRAAVGDLARQVEQLREALTMAHDLEPPNPAADAPPDEPRLDRAAVERS